ncbi:hypothetical protein PS15p_204044 [Mucor circinelloides]
MYFNSATQSQTYSPHQSVLLEAARQVLFTCHPMYDSSLVIQTTFHTDKGVINKSSRLNANDTLYHLPELSEGITASSSFGVSIFNHNSTHMTLGIKKTAHVTMKSQEKPATLPSDCTSINRTNTTNNFVDLPYDSVLCSLLNIGNTDSNKPKLVQALSRVYIENYALDTLYTRLKDDK